MAIKSAWLALDCKVVRLTPRTCKESNFYIVTLRYSNMAFKMQSTDIGNIGSHEFYRPIKDLENIKANISSVPNLRNELMKISRIMFQDALHSQVGIDKISVIKFDLDKF